jgi:hypothetical protein
MSLGTVNNVTTRCAAFVLFAIGISKFLDATGNQQYFKDPDTLVSFMSHRQLMLFGAACEIVVGLFIFYSNSLIRRGLALLWWCGVLTVYKVGLICTYDVLPCSCLGIFGRAMKLSNSALTSLTWSILIISALIGGLAVFARERVSVNDLRKGSAVGR